jgi:hypothetical protein
VRPLTSAPRLSAAELYRNAVEWMAVSAILQRLPGVSANGDLILLFAAGILFARDLIDGVLLSWTEVAGLLIGILAWNLGLSRLPRRALVLAALMGGILMVAGSRGNRFPPPFPPSSRHSFCAVRYSGFFARRRHRGRSAAADGWSGPRWSPVNSYLDGSILGRGNHLKNVRIITRSGHILQCRNEIRPPRKQP